MYQMSNLSEDKLLEKEQDWWKHEDESNFSWVTEGVEIFKNLSKMNPNEIAYKETLAYLLLIQGEDLKLRQHSYERAITRFKQVTRIDPGNARAFYRLGFLYFYQEMWAKSIESFQASLNCRPRQSRNQLLKEQEIKAHYYILKGTQFILNDSLVRIERIPSEDLALFGEMKSLLKELKESGRTEEKPYQMIVNGVEFSEISEREYEQLSDPDENKNVIILNQRTMNDATLSVNERDVTIPPLQIPLLEYLMRHPEGVRREEIIQRMYRHSRDPQAALRRSISRLRERIQRIDPILDCIETIEGGYRWNSLYPYRMFKHQRDVSTDLLLD